MLINAQDELFPKSDAFDFPLGNKAFKKHVVNVESLQTLIHNLITACACFYRHAEMHAGN